MGRVSRNYVYCKRLFDQVAVAKLVIDIRKLCQDRLRISLRGLKIHLYEIQEHLVLAQVSPLVLTISPGKGFLFGWGRVRKPR
jgi:hypothetical protein